MFSWSYYGTSDGIEANTRDSYTEHVMRIQWGKTADTMISWMVARRSVFPSGVDVNAACHNWMVDCLSTFDFIRLLIQNIHCKAYEDMECDCRSITSAGSRAVSWIPSRQTRSPAKHSIWNARFPPFCEGAEVEMCMGE